MTNPIRPGSQDSSPSYERYYDDQNPVAKYEQLAHLETEPADGSIEAKLKAMAAQVQEKRLTDELGEIIKQKNQPAIEAASQWRAKNQQLSDQLRQAEEGVKFLGEDSTGLIPALEAEIENHIQFGLTDPQVQLGRKILLAETAQADRLREAEKARIASEKAKFRDQKSKTIIEDASQIQHFGPPHNNEKISFAGIIETARAFDFIEEINPEEIKQNEAARRQYEARKAAGAKVPEKKPGFPCVTLIEKGQTKYYTYKRKEISTKTGPIKVQFDPKAGEVYKAVQDAFNRCRSVDQKRYQEKAQQEADAKAIREKAAAKVAADKAASEAQLQAEYARFKEETDGAGEMFITNQGVIFTKPHKGPKETVRVVVKSTDPNFTVGQNLPYDDTLLTEKFPQLKAAIARQKAQAEKASAETPAEPTLPVAPYVEPAAPTASAAPATPTTNKPAEPETPFGQIPITQALEQAGITPPPPPPVPPVTSEKPVEAGTNP